MPKQRIKEVVVLGAGTMGMGIAAHLANVGLDVWVLNRKKSDTTAKDLQKKFLKFSKVHPSPLYLPSYSRRIKFGTFEDDLSVISKCDWVIESITEKLEVKSDLYKKILPYIKESTVISSNTSGLSINELSQIFPQKIQKQFLGIHFFNPPRYLKLIEIIPHKTTDSKMIEFMTQFMENTLGKRVVLAPDVTGFIANRIGVFTLATAIKYMQIYDLNMEEIDQLTGEILGRPRSGTFRTLDVIGLDTVKKVTDYFHENLQSDPYSEVFKLPDFINHLIEKNHLGAKTKTIGCYKKTKDKDQNTILEMLDWKTENYILMKREFPENLSIIQEKDLNQRFNLLFQLHGKFGNFYQSYLLEIIEYALFLISEINTDIYKIDNALKWGFGWEMGIFEILECIDKKYLEKNSEIPKLISETDNLELNHSSCSVIHKVLPQKYKNLKNYTNNFIFQRENTSLRHIGDGILAISFHTKMNTINLEVVEDFHETLNLLNNDSDLKGLVIINSGSLFSAGFDLSLILKSARDQRWKEIDTAVKRFQEMNQKIRFSQKPVVTAVHGMTLGGGLEIALSSASIIASPESYIGLPEMAVGILPAGGGCKEMMRRVDIARNIVPNLNPMPFIQCYGESIGMGKVSFSAEQARDYGYLASTDRIVKNADTLLFYAKQRVLSLVADQYKAPEPVKITLWGEQVAANLWGLIKMLRTSNHISDYDLVILDKLIDIFCGEQTLPTQVSEDFILESERNSFLELVKNKETHDRIDYTLKHGKPSRNIN